MRPTVDHVVQFLRRERGAATVDYVVLAAAVTMVAIGSHNVVRGGMQGLAGTVDSELSRKEADSLIGIAYSDGFDNGMSGWAGALAASIPGIGNVLGPIGGTGGAPRVTRDFYTDPNAAQATFSFDLYAMDSLDKESGIIYIDGVEIGRLTSNFGRSSFTAADGLKARGITIRATEIDSDVDLGGNTQWRDALSSISVTIDDPADRVTFGFGSTANQSTSDESFAIDNFVATGLRDGNAI